MKKQKNDRREIRRSVLLGDAGLQLRESKDGKPSRTIAGYAILFDTPSAALWEDEETVAREVIERTAITQELLDGSDIKFTMYHDRQILLGRSNHGQGTLSYQIDERGVAFMLELPESPYGDEALSAVKRGDISGCSFAFSTYYWDDGCVSREVSTEKDGRRLITYRVKTITGIHDFTLASDPAYPDTSVEARELAAQLREMADPDPEPINYTPEAYLAQIREMREISGHRLS